MFDYWIRAILLLFSLNFFISTLFSLFKRINSRCQKKKPVKRVTLLRGRKYTVSMRNLLSFHKVLLPLERWGCFEAEVAFQWNRIRRYDPFDEWFTWIRRMIRWTIRESSSSAKMKQKKWENQVSVRVVRKTREAGTRFSTSWCAFFLYSTWCSINGVARLRVECSQMLF